MRHTPTPRSKYQFGQMKVGEILDVEITEDDPRAGARALCAAYAYGRRHNMQFCGLTEIYRKKKYMRISRSK